MTDARSRLPCLPRRRGARIGLALAAVLLPSLVLLILFGWGLLRHPLERRLSAAWGRPVTIGSLARVGGLLRPTLALGDVRVGQPPGIPGELLLVRRARLAVPLGALLRGRPNPETLEMDGLRLRLVRLDSARASWKGLPKAEGGRPALHHLRIANGQLLFDDRPSRHRLVASFTVDEAGLRLAGGGTLAGRPARVALQGPAVTRAGPWPFRLAYRSPIVGLDLAGVADRPLDIGHFAAEATARADSLAHLDLLIGAGLPATQPVSLVARLRHDRPDWRIGRLRGRIGRTDLATAFSVIRRDGRARVDGRVAFADFHPDDLADAAGRVRAAAERAAAGPRLIPGTRIDLRSLAGLDGRLDVRMRRVALGPRSVFGGLAATVTLDHGTLVADPFSVAVGPGRLAGTVRIVQRGATPRLALDLRLAGAPAGGVIASPDALSGALTGRFALTGDGGTVRAALARADGRFALVARDGAIGRRIALLLGQDAGRALFAGKEGRTSLRCAVAAFRVAGGVARPAPFVIDTDLAQAIGAGTLDLATERLDLTLTGAPKQPSALRLAGPIRLTGPLATPHADAPGAASLGGILKSIGRALVGDNPPLATDADCPALTLAALR